MSKPRSLDKSTKEDVSFIDRQPDQLTNQSAGQAEPELPTGYDSVIAQQSSTQNISALPVDVLPPRLQEIINEANICLGFPKDYLAGAMLTAMAAVIGNTHTAEIMPGWKEYAILFTALVGSPGTNKSHPLSFAVQPLIDFDAEQAAIFGEAMKRYEAAMELSPKDRAAKGYDTNPVEPKRVRFTMQDVTPEAVHRILSENRRGLVLVSDELAGWFKNFNRYNNGSESEFWMSVFNHKAAMSDRKSSQSGVFIRNPFLCVIGTIQPKVLTELAAGNRNANGFMERILYVFPSVQSKVRWNRERKSPSFDISVAWREILSRLIGIVPAVDSCGEIIPEDVPFSPEALDRLFSWQNEVTDRCNAEGSDTLTSIASKLEIYAVRFSLLLALADRACGDEKKQIDADTVERAIRLTEYFRVTAAKVQGIVSEDALTELQLAVLSELPGTFTTAIKANDNSMDGEKQVVIRLLECLCYSVEFSFVGAGIVGLRLAGHTSDKITMHAHSKAEHIYGLLNVGAPVATLLAVVNLVDDHIVLLLAVGRYVERGEPGFAAVLRPGKEVENALLLLHDAFLLLAAVGDALASENRFPIFLGNLDLILDRCGVAEFRLLCKSDELLDIIPLAFEQRSVIRNGIISAVRGRNSRYHSVFSARVFNL